MIIKLSKSDWRLVGQKMGWLKGAKVAGKPTEVMGKGAAEGMKKELVGNQKKLDVNKNKRLDAEDFSMLRAKGKRKANHKSNHKAKG